MTDKEVRAEGYESMRKELSERPLDGDLDHACRSFLVTPGFVSTLLGNDGQFSSGQQAALDQARVEMHEKNGTACL